MTFRKIISLSIAFSFTILAVTGLLSYFNDYSRVLATVHTVEKLNASMQKIENYFRNKLDISSTTKIKPIGGE